MDVIHISCSEKLYALLTAKFVNYAHQLLFFGISLIFRSSLNKGYYHTSLTITLYTTSHQLSELSSPQIYVLTMCGWNCHFPYHFLSKIELWICHLVIWFTIFLSLSFPLYIFIEVKAS